MYLARGAVAVLAESSALRVVHVISTPTGTGGAEQTLSQLISFGDEQGWEQLVLNPFALDPEDSDVRRMCSAARYEGFRCRSWQGLPRLRTWLAGRLAGFRPEIVHAHLFHASVLLATLRRPPGARLVLSHHHGDHFLATGRPGHELVDRVVGRRFDQVVACSQAMEDYLLYRHHYASSRVSHVYNGWRGDPLPRAAPSSRNVICVAGCS